MGRSIGYYQYMRSPQWRNTSRSIITRYPRCCLFPWLKARHAHHLHYRNFKEELPIRDIVSLSATAHKIIHCPLLWKTKIRIFVNYWLRVTMVLQWILK